MNLEQGNDGCVEMIGMFPKSSIVEDERLDFLLRSSRIEGVLFNVINLFKALKRPIHSTRWPVHSWSKHQSVNASLHIIDYWYLSRQSQHALRKNQKIFFSLNYLVFFLNQWGKKNHFLLCLKVDFYFYKMSLAVRLYHYDRYVFFFALSNNIDLWVER